MEMFNVYLYSIPVVIILAIVFAGFVSSIDEPFAKEFIKESNLLDAVWIGITWPIFLLFVVGAVIGESIKKGEDDE